MNKFKLSLASRFLLSLISTIILFSACQKNFPQPNDEVTIINNDFVEKIVTAASGFVTDENNLPVLGATVRAGVKTATTDRYGYFEITGTELVKNAAFLTVTKDGYFKGIKTWIAAQGKSGFFRIKLLPKTSAGIVSGTTGGDVLLAGGMKISFPANAIVNAVSGTAYTGAVTVKAQWINPTSSELNNIMPGDLRGKDASGTVKLLTTYGMAAVELASASGDLLQIATGKKATLTMPIPTTIIGNAPTTIPLWYFDEPNGLWKEEGSATKVGTNYVGDVSHFSFWNCDVPNNYVQFNCRVVNTAGQSIPNAQVKISLVSNPNMAAYGYTDTSGYVSGAVPNNATLLLQVFSNYSCGTASFTQTFTTANANVAYGNVVINTATNIATLTGTVTNCSGVPVTSGFIVVQNGYYFTKYPLSSTGSYSINHLICGLGTNSIILIGEDILGGQQSNAATYNINSGANAIPNIQACGVTIEQFVNTTINGVATSYVYPTDSLTLSGQGGTSSYFIFAQRVPVNSTPATGFQFTSTGIATGSVQNLLSFSGGPLPTTGTIASPINVNITEFGAIGQFMAGNFTGIIIGPAPSNTPYNVVCNFRIRRTF